jgi:hypothetical protein
VPPSPSKIEADSDERHAQHVGDDKVGWHGSARMMKYYNGNDAER